MSDEIVNVDEFLLRNDPVVPKLFDPAAQERRLSKIVLIDRLEAAGLFEAALSALKSNPLLYERWQASKGVDVNNDQVIGLITAIGGDAKTLLSLD